MTTKQLDGLWLDENVKSKTLTIEDSTINSLVLDNEEKIINKSIARKLEQFPNQYSHFFDLDNKKVILQLSLESLELYEMDNDIFVFNPKLKIGRFKKV
jgi:hypothetical protein